MPATKIQSLRVVLVEGYADEIVPRHESAFGMHGFAIMVPPGEGGERLLEMLWRITMTYAGKPSLIASRATVRKMVEAVMSKESREPKPASHRARKSGKADRAQGGKLVLSRPLTGPAPSPNAKLRTAIASLPAPREGSKAKTRKRN